jgi:hypothetical protein
MILPLLNVKRKSVCLCCVCVGVCEGVCGGGGGCVRARYSQKSLGSAELVC